MKQQDNQGEPVFSRWWALIAHQIDWRALGRDIARFLRAVFSAEPQHNRRE